MAPLGTIAVALLGCFSSLALGAPTATSDGMKMMGKRASVNDVSFELNVAHHALEQHSNFLMW